jgi:hypothetical protein
MPRILQFALHPDPNLWGLSPESIEEDDWLHEPDKNIDNTGSIFTGRGFTTVGFSVLLMLGLVGLLYVRCHTLILASLDSIVTFHSLGFPVTSAILRKSMSNNGGFNLGGINATGQVMEGIFSLIDKDTPQDAYTIASPVDGKSMQLVFSDEFETEGRTFYPVSGRFFPLTGPDRNIDREMIPSGKPLIFTTG